MRNEKFNSIQTRQSIQNQQESVPQSDQATSPSKHIESRNLYPIMPKLQNKAPFPLSESEIAKSEIAKSEIAKSEIECPEDYPPIWRTAFSLAHNVRFTRTPDIELLAKKGGLTNLTHERIYQLLEQTIQQHTKGKKDPAPPHEATNPNSLQESITESITESMTEKSNSTIETPDLSSQTSGLQTSGLQTSGLQTNELQANGLFLSDSAFFEYIDCILPEATIQKLPQQPAQEKQNTLPNTPKKNLETPNVSYPSLDKLKQLYRLVDKEPTILVTKIQDNPIKQDKVPVPAPLSSFETIAVSSLENKAAPERPILPNTYHLPPITLLQQPIYQDGNRIPQETLQRSAGILENVLEDFGIKGEIIHISPGPVVTLYEFEPAPGIKSSRIIGLSDDIARSMSAVSTRVAVIPGRNVIGIELPNTVREIVYLREILHSVSFKENTFKLPLALGKTISGEPVIVELSKMPHLLVAGTTGSGKSVAINTMILSLLYHLSPKQCRLIMIDPKMLELSIYDGIPHLLTPVVTDSKKAITALKWAVREMEDRYRKMATLGVRNIDSFNERIGEAIQNNETIYYNVQTGFDKETGEMISEKKEMSQELLPYIVIIVDEMADLMMVAGKEIEGVIQRLAQMARAAGIHLIMATQRPSVDVITGTIKANFPTRISFQVTSKIDSRTILGEQGAETLLGQGDMLHMIGSGRVMRVHGPFVSDGEVESVVSHLKMQAYPEYLSTLTDAETDEKDTQDTLLLEKANNDTNIHEELYQQAIKIVFKDKKCSTSYIQRRLSIGYNKAASLVERMEQEGLVGPANHVGKREILREIPSH